MWLYGSISTQPLIASGYFQTMLRINALAEEVAALATVPDRPVDVHIESNGGSAIGGYDMLNGEAVQGSGIAMPFQGVRLIRVSGRE